MKKKFYKLISGKIFPKKKKRLKTFVSLENDQPLPTKKKKKQ